MRLPAIGSAARIAIAAQSWRRCFASLPSVQSVVWVTGHTDAAPIPVGPPAVDWATAIATASPIEFADVEFSHPLWVLFSSGTTGMPKGIVHGHGGALLEQLKLCSIHDDIRTGDRVLTIASTSWVVWNGLVAALGVGATAVLIDGNPTFPSLDRVWQIASAERVSVLGVGAGFIHACGKAALEPGRDHDLSALRTVAVTGSPLSGDGFRWIYHSVGDVWVTSQSGGTDIASIFVGGVPTLPVRVGYIQAPALGVRVESWNEQGDPTLGRGELVVTDPIPSMPLFFWGDPDGARYHASYFETFPGVWRHGDFIELGHRGILIHGRSDSTLNRNGIRLGSADIYAAVEALPEVAEAMVVGAEMGTDYYMPLFVKLADGADAADARSGDRVRDPRESVGALPPRRDRRDGGHPAHEDREEAGSAGQAIDPRRSTRRGRRPRCRRRPGAARGLRPVRQSEPASPPATERHAHGVRFVSHRRALRSKHGHSQ